MYNKSVHTSIEDCSARASVLHVANAPVGIPGILLGSGLNNSSSSSSSSVVFNLTGGPPPVPPRRHLHTGTFFNTLDFQSRHVYMNVMENED